MVMSEMSIKNCNGEEQPLTEEIPFSCATCEKTSEEKYVPSDDAETGDKNDSCRECGRKPTRKISLVHTEALNDENSKKTLTEEIPFSCATCEKTSEENYVPSDDAETGDKNESCRECGRKPTRKISLVHTEALNDEKYYACDTCGKEFNRKCNLIIHFRIHTGEKEYTCSVCGKEFAHKNTLTVHHRIHTGEKNYECAICERKFAHKSNLTAHIKTHDAKRKKNHICEECGEVFYHKASLSNHKRSHINGLGTLIGQSIMQFGEDQSKNGEKCFACKLCEKKFNKKTYLKDHIRVHIGEKRFICEYCGKKFRQKNHLVTHTTIHTGERKFACGDCGKRFSQKSHLRVHARTHTGEKNFVCGQCGKRFNIKSHLNYHIRIHTGEKKYMCEICGRQFTQNSALTWHLKNHTHGKGERRGRKRGRKKICKSEILECNFCQEKFTDEILLNEHRKYHQDQDAPEPSVLEQLNAEMSLEDIDSVVQEMQNVINEILPLGGLTANTSCVVKTENLPEEVQNLISETLPLEDASDGERSPLMELSHPIKMEMEMEEEEEEDVDGDFDSEQIYQD